MSDVKPWEREKHAGSCDLYRAERDAQCDLVKWLESIGDVALDSEGWWVRNKLEDWQQLRKGLGL